MQRYISSVLTPFGRLPPDIYPLIFTPLLLMIIAVHLTISTMENPYGLLLGVMCGLVWLMYCIMSSRIHDCGHPGAVYMLPFLLLTSWWLIAFYDPSIDDSFLLGPEGQPSTLFSALCLIRILATAALPGIWIYCVLGNEAELKADESVLSRIFTRPPDPYQMREETKSAPPAAAPPPPVFGKR